MTLIGKAAMKSFITGLVSIILALGILGLAFFFGLWFAERMAGGTLVQSYAQSTIGLYSGTIIFPLTAISLLKLAKSLVARIGLFDGEMVFSFGCVFWFLAAFVYYLTLFFTYG